MSVLWLWGTQVCECVSEELARRSTDSIKNIFLPRQGHHLHCGGSEQKKKKKWEGTMCFFGFLCCLGQLILFPLASMTGSSDSYLFGPGLSHTTPWLSQISSLQMVDVGLLNVSILPSIFIYPVGGFSPEKLKSKHFIHKIPKHLDIFKYLILSKITSKSIKNWNYQVHSLEESR